MIDNDYDTAYEGVITYTCFFGYKLNGTTQGTVECDATGQWNITSSQHIGLDLSEFHCLGKTLLYLIVNLSRTK